MRILIVHNRYNSTLTSGEDIAVDAEVALLERHGHIVERFERHNDTISGVLGRLGAALSAVHNPNAVDDLTDRLRSFRPDVVHLHSVMPLISPSAIAAADQFGCGIVATLHNYRQICMGGMLVRDAKPCTKCVGSSQLPALRYGCYRDSRAATLPLVVSHGLHDRKGTWQRVHRFICPSEPVRQHHIDAGFTPDRLVVKPHFVDPMPAPARNADGPAIYVGRLDVSKGVRHLINAWRSLPEQAIQLLGDGPLRADLEHNDVVRRTNVDLLGQLPLPDARQRIAEASFVVIPSLAPETFSLVMADAMASGKPIIASEHGAPASILSHDHTALLYPPGNDQALVDAVRRLAATPDLAETLRQGARALAEEMLDPDRNHDQLIEIYQQAINEATR